MGYPLYREIKVWAPLSLTHREKLTAMVLADDANDTSRLTFHSTEDPDLMRYSLVKNDRDMRKILARLRDEKVLEAAGGGHNGRVAKFRFLHLDPDGCPGRPDCTCPTALPVQKEPPTGAAAEGVGGPESTGYTEGSGQKEPPTDGVGGSNRHRSRSKKNRPTPLTSSTTSPLPPDVGDPAPGSRERENPATAVNSDTAAVAAAWAAARTGRRNATAEAKVAKSAVSFLAIGWPLGEVVAMAEHMARNYPTGTDLALHEPHWTQSRHSPRPSRLPKWCGCGAGNPHAEFNGRFRTHDGTANGQPCLVCHPDTPQES